MNQKKIVLEQLNAMGFEPVELGNWGYVFNYEDVNYLYIPDDDGKFLRIVIPHLFDVTGENRVAVLDAMQKTGVMMKYTKVCIMNENAVWAIYEHHLISTDKLSELLEHMIRVLEATAHVFYKNISGEDVMGSSEENPDEEVDAQLQKILDDIESDIN